MVAHQAVGVADPVETFSHGADQAKEPLPVLIVKIDVLPPMTTGREVIESIGELDAERPGHGGKEKPREYGSVRPDPSALAAACLNIPVCGTLGIVLAAKQ